MSDKVQKNVAVIGAGIAGLTVAWRLKNAGCGVRVFEQSGYVGGCIKSVSDNGYLLEMGPNTFLNSSKALWKLADDLGLSGSRIAAGPEVGKRRYIYRSDRLIEVPAGPKLLFSPILSMAGRLRILKEPFVAKKNDDQDESLASFVRRRLGKEVLRYLVTPFVSGVYAGDPERLSLRSIFPKLAKIERDHGGIFKGMKAFKGDIKSSGLGSFDSGMATMITGLERGLGGSVVRNAKVQSAAYTGSGFKLTFEKNVDVRSEENFDALVVATPSFAASRIVASIDRDISDQLARIEYAPIVVVHLGYKKDAVKRKLDGFGYLVPRGENVRQLGSLWSSSLFARGAPKDHVLFTNFIGGMLDAEACDLTDDDILKQLRADLKRTVGVSDGPEFVSITRYAHAIPQLNLGYDGLMRVINEKRQKINGLHFAGSYAREVSVAGTIEHAEEVANAVIDS